MFVSIKCYDPFGLCNNYNCHTDTLHLVAGSESIFNICYNCFCKLLCSDKISCNYLQYNLFFKAPHCLVVISFVITLSMALILFVTTVVQIFSVFNLIREIRDNSLFVYGFNLNMLNMIVCTISCEQYQHCLVACTMDRTSWVVHLH